MSGRNNEKYYLFFSSVFLIRWEIIFFIRRFIGAIIIVMEWTVMYSACVIISLYALRNKRMILRYAIRWFAFILHVVILMNVTRIQIIVVFSRWFSYSLVERSIVGIMERVVFRTRIKWIKRESSSWRRLLRNRCRWYCVRSRRLTWRNWKRKVLLWLLLLLWLFLLRWYLIWRLKGLSGIRQLLLLFLG